MSAQSYKGRADMEGAYHMDVKGTKHTQSKDRHVKTASFENGFQFSIGYSMPFPADLKGYSRYGARAEAGYITDGRYSFYTGIAYQYIGIGGIISEHDIVFPEQFSMRFNPGVPIQLKAGPFIGVDVYNASRMNGIKNHYPSGVSFSDLILCGLQFDLSISYFHIGYTLERDALFNKHMCTSLLTIGVTF